MCYSVICIEARRIAGSCFPPQADSTTEIRIPILEDCGKSRPLAPKSWQYTSKFQTTLPGVFAVGDVRSGNVKRVASAVGEGAIAIHLVHRTLTEL